MKLNSRPITWSLLIVPLLVSALAIPATAHSQQGDRESRQQEHKSRVQHDRSPSLKGERVEQYEETRRRRPMQADGRKAPTPTQPAPAAVTSPQPSRSVVTPTSPQPQLNRRDADRRAFDRQRNPTQHPNRLPSSPPASRFSQSDRYSGNHNGGYRGNGSQAYRPRQSSGGQERRIRVERQQADRYFASQARQRDIATQRARMLQQQRRGNQYRYQNQYDQRVRQQHVVWNSRNYDYYRDPFYSTPANYRYQFGGQWQTTNRYGADLMQQAVDYGYQEGLRAGGADRQDGWRADYGNSYAYQDGTYGYNGRYISPAEYQHYFRQGFRRGYQDGYSDRYSYGYRRNDGSYGVIAAVLAAIVGLQLFN